MDDPGNRYRVRTGDVLSSGNTLRALTIAMAVAAMSAASLRSSIAIPDRGDRELSLYNIHTKERLKIVYKRRGKFVPDALKRLNRFARDWRRSSSTKMDKRLFDLLWELHSELGSKEPIHLISGYRSPKTNAMLRKKRGGQARRSRHMLGMAMDVHFPDVPVKRLRYSALVRQIGGVGYYPTSAIPFIHVDTGRVRHWPRMPRYELALLFPNGKTKHRPSSGGPITPRDARIARTKYAKLAQEVADFHDLRKGGNRRRTLLASLSPPKPSFVRAGGSPSVADVQPAVGTKPGTQLASIDPRLILRSKPQPAQRPVLRQSNLGDRDPLADLLTRNRVDETRIPPRYRSGFRQGMTRENNQRQKARQTPPHLRKSPTEFVRTRPAPKNNKQEEKGYLERARIALKTKIDGLLRLARLSPAETKTPQQADVKTPAPRVSMPDDRPDYSNNWAAAPSFDEEHPDELSYRPFPIAPLLTFAYDTAPMFSELVHPDQARIFEWIEPDDTRIRLEFRPGLEYAELLFNHQFKGDAVTLPALLGNRRSGRKVRTAAGR